MTPLFIACQEGKLECAQAVIAAGADLDMAQEVRRAGLVCCPSGCRCSRSLSRGHTQWTLALTTHQP